MAAPYSVDLDVRGLPGDHPLLPRGAHLPEAQSLLLEDGRQRRQEKHCPLSRGLDGRVQELLL